MYDLDDSGGNSQDRRRRKRHPHEDMGMSRTQRPQKAEVATRGWSFSDRLAFALFCLASVLAIVLYWIDKTPTAAGASIALIGMLVIYPLLHFVQKLLLRIIVFVFIALLIAGFGMKIWPSKINPNEAPQQTSSPRPKPQQAAPQVGAVAPTDEQTRHERRTATAKPQGSLKSYGIYVHGSSSDSSKNPCSQGELQVDGFTATNVTEAVHTEGKIPCTKIKDLQVQAEKPPLPPAPQTPNRIATVITNEGDSAYKNACAVARAMTFNDQSYRRDVNIASGFKHPTPDHPHVDLSEGSRDNLYQISLGVSSGWRVERPEVERAHTAGVDRMLIPGKLSITVNEVKEDEVEYSKAMQSADANMTRSDIETGNINLDRFALIATYFKNLCDRLANYSEFPAPQ
jgi:hypothetical protein